MQCIIESLTTSCRESVIKKFREKNGNFETAIARKLKFKIFRFHAFPILSRVRSPTCVARIPRSAVLSMTCVTLILRSPRAHIASPHWKHRTSDKLEHGNLTLFSTSLSLLRVERSYTQKELATNFLLNYISDASQNIYGCNAISKVLVLLSRASTRRSTFPECFSNLHLPPPRCVTQSSRIFVSM